MGPLAEVLPVLRVEARRDPVGGGPVKPRHTPEAFRQQLAAFYPRPGWKARNLDADMGRCYDLFGYRDYGAVVDWDWDNHWVVGYLGNERVYEADDVGSAEAIQAAMAAVEDAAIARLNREIAESGE
jgi:hypothetical protein